jgi:DNA topoisomerase-3
MSEIKVLTYRVGQVVYAASAGLDEMETKPPGPYTQPELLDDMLKAYRFAKTPEDRQILKETDGLGTARTRPPIIEGMIKRALFVAQKHGKRNYVRASPFLRQLVEILPPTMTDIALTAKWETAFGLVESGQVPLERLLEQERMFVTMLVERAKEVAKEFAGGAAGGAAATTGRAAANVSNASAGATYAKKAR